MSDSRNGRKDLWGDLILVAAPLLVLFGLTCSRDLGTIDSGELAVVCLRLGIAHPTGYPLYTLLGRVATLLSPLSPILTLNLLSAVLGGLGGFLTVGLARTILEAAGTGGALRSWVPRAAGVWLATDRVFWDQSTGNEVYVLHMVFVLMLARLGLRLLRNQVRLLDLVLLAWISGLALANHLSIVFLAPALIWAVGRPLVHGARSGARELIRIVAPMAAAGAGAVSVLLYLPIRSAREPVLDWGDPEGPGSFYRHILAAQYRVWLFESGQQWAANLGSYLLSLPSRLSWPVLLLAVPGLWLLIRRAGRLAVFLGLIWTVTAAWAASYEIHDLAPYFLPADLATVLFAALGASWLGAALSGPGEGLPSVGRPKGGKSGGEPDRANPDASGKPGFFSPGRRRETMVLASILVAAAAQAAWHYSRADRSRDRLVRVHAETLLQSLPPRTILYSRHWDALVSPCLYLQEVEGRRRDVTLVDPELARRSWYFDQLPRWDAGLLLPLEDRLSTLLAQLRLFEEGRPYDPMAIEAAYQNLLRGMAEVHAGERPIAFTPDVDPPAVPGQVPVPEGLVLRLTTDPAASPLLEPPPVDRLLDAGYRPHDAIHGQILEAWRRLISMRIGYLTAMQRTEEIPPWEKALQRLDSMPRQ